MILARSGTTILSVLVTLTVSMPPAVAETSCKSSLFGFCTSRYSPLPIVPAPKGFIEASGLSTDIRNGALAGHPSSDKLIGVYYPPEVLAEILNGGHPEPAAFCRAHVIQELESTNAADTYLRGPRTIPAFGDFCLS
jgi:hypothetical protein